MHVRNKNILIPAAIFAVFAGLYAVVTLVNGSHLLFRPVWDVGHYQSIAERGYEVMPCDPKIHYPVGDYCGNVGWFPAWPVALKILSLGQVSVGIRVLPYVFGLLGFIAFYNLLRRLVDYKSALIGTMALASAPSAFYFLTGFPYSFILVLFCAYLYYLYEKDARGRVYLLPLLALSISLSYPSAFLMAIIPLTLALNQYRKQTVKPAPVVVIRDLLYHLIPFALGPLLLSLYFYLAFDDFLLILHFQEKYHRQWGLPFTVLWESLTTYPLYYVENATFLYYGLIFLVFFRYRLRAELVAYVLLGYLFSPATGSVMSVYRHYLLLFPAAMMIGTSHRSLWIELAFVALGLALALLRFFPIFMAGHLI